MFPDEPDLEDVVHGRSATIKIDFPQQLHCFYAVESHTVAPAVCWYPERLFVTAILAYGVLVPLLQHTFRCLVLSRGNLVPCQQGLAGRQGTEEPSSKT